jgi:hypothetical protein
MDIPTSFIWMIIFLDKACNGATFWGSVGIHAEPLCVEFCNFVQCHIFVNSVTYYYYTDTSPHEKTGQKH